jgi:A/G-specific adenine glycosylase
MRKVGVRLGSEEIKEFRKRVYRYYRKNGRDLAWRRTDDPYKILISEIMLQQTHVQRVKTKYEEFLATFPDIYSIERSSLRKLLKEWKGLGYNRRALNLKRIAKIVIDRFEGRIPSSVEELESLPGIGTATARSVRVFAFNKPEVFVETNIRSVYIHHFFPGRTGVKDSEIFPLVEWTLDRKNPRKWYSALMDYGVEIKKRFSNPGRKSGTYRKQAAFLGSHRQIRGEILRILTEKGRISLRTLLKNLSYNETRIKRALTELEREGFLRVNKRSVTLTR